jgi:hypothetical protein
MKGSNKINIKKTVLILKFENETNKSDQLREISVNFENVEIETINEDQHQENSIHFRNLRMKR